MHSANQILTLLRRVSGVLSVSALVLACSADGAERSGALAGVFEGRGGSGPSSSTEAGRPLAADSGSPVRPSVDASIPDAATPDGEDDMVPTRTQFPSGPSAGCGHAAPSGDSANAWTKHELMVAGVAARFLKGGDQYGSQGGYDFSRRNFFLRLPAAYDAKQAYALVISGGGCGATNGISGNGGGSNPLGDHQDVAVQIGLSYVYPMAAGACFSDGSADTPDLPYFDAVLAEVDKAYCFDRSKVFVSGFSSGAWETYMLACARSGVIRGIGTQAGGLRKERPACANLPLAAFLTAGVNDANPIENIDKTGFDSGSQAARDVILKTNGCTNKDTTPYVTPEAPADWNCLRYTSCPAASPVIWCAITANGGGHGAGSNKAFWPFWIALPAR